VDAPIASVVIGVCTIPASSRTIQRDIREEQLPEEPFEK
jgi:hypothetical protein